MTISQVFDDDGDAAGQLDELLSAAIARMRGLVETDVERVKRRRPGLSQRELARALAKRGTRRVGTASFTTGFGGAPTNVTSVLTLQAATVLAVAATYDELDSPDLRQDLVLILAGNSADVALREFGVAAANDMGKSWVQRNVTRQTMKQVNKATCRKILTKAGEKSLTSFIKLVPVAGAAVGYNLDRGCTRVLGESAICYYSGGQSAPDLIARGCHADDTPVPRGARGVTVEGGGITPTEGTSIDDTGSQRRSVLNDTCSAPNWDLAGFPSE